MSSLPPPPPPPAGMTSFPEQAYDGRGELAGFGVRLGGLIVDQILYGLLMAPFVLASLALGGFDDDPKAAGVAVQIVGGVIVFVLYLSHLGKTGQTWGRKMLGIKVVDARTQQPIGMGRGFLRLLLEGTISRFVCLLGYFWMLWDEDNQTWHDKIVNSIVVRA